MLAVDGATLGAVITSLLTGTAAVITAAGGILIATKEGRRRERKADVQRRKRQFDELHAYQEDHLADMGYCYKLRKLLTEAGIEYPPPPPSKVAEYQEKVLIGELE